jgi:hypothetical protein
MDGFFNKLLVDIEGLTDAEDQRLGRLAHQVFVRIKSGQANVDIGDSGGVASLEIGAIEVLIERAVFRVQALMRDRERVERVVLRGSGEVLVLAQRDIDSHEAIAKAQVHLLLGVVEIAGVVIAGKACAVAELAKLAAIAEVTVNLQSVAGLFADVRSPDTGVKSIALEIDAAGSRRRFLVNATEVIIAGPADIGGLLGARSSRCCQQQAGEPRFAIVCHEFYLQ